VAAVAAALIDAFYASIVRFFFLATLAAASKTLCSLFATSAAARVSLWYYSASFLAAVEATHTSF